MRYLPLLAVSLFSMNATAQMYSWKDADGKMHYTDQLPPGQTSVRKIAPPPASAVDPAVARQQAATREMESRLKRKDAQEAAAKTEKEQAAAEERRVGCERAKGRLKAIESGVARFTINASGERVALDGPVRDAELGNARKAVDDWCN